MPVSRNAPARSSYKFGRRSATIRAHFFHLASGFVVTVRAAKPQPSGEQIVMNQELRTERELSLDFLRVCEAAAIAAARTMGQGDRKFSDHVAVEAMREVMDTVP